MTGLLWRIYNWFLGGYPEARREHDAVTAELELLIYAMQHPGEWVEVPEGHPARDGVLANAWREKPEANADLTSFKAKADGPA